jgi:hypothetical protein
MFVGQWRRLDESFVTGHRESSEPRKVLPNSFFVTRPSHASVPLRCVVVVVPQSRREQGAKLIELNRDIEYRRCAGRKSLRVPIRRHSGPAADVDALSHRFHQVERVGLD